MNLASMFARSAELHADKTAVFWGEAEYTYRELRRLSRAVASRLRNRYSVRAGDFVGLLLRNRPEFIPALFGSLETGAVAVPINHFLKPDEISYITVDATIKVLITESAFAEFLPKLSEMQPGLEFLLIDEVTADEDKKWEPPPASADRGETDLHS
jgi:long-chain acyl-CoA synthetase